MTHGHIPFNMLISTMYYSNMLMRLCEKTDFVTPFPLPLRRRRRGGVLMDLQGSESNSPSEIFIPREKTIKFSFLVFEPLFSI